MRKVVQDFKTGEIKLIETPEPLWRPGGVLVETLYSVISTGTERTTVETGKASLLGKASKRPDLVKKVIESAKRYGIKNTMRMVKEKLDVYRSMGYSSSGKVLVADEENEFNPGMHVACGGGFYAAHSEVVWVPNNLCVQVPDGVNMDEAAYTTIGSIALWGVRQSQAEIGEWGIVIGLGLVGMLTCKILKAAGVNVIGIDVNESRVEFARNSGIEFAYNRAQKGISEEIIYLTNGLGPDFSIITASTKSNDPLDFSTDILRDRGRIIVVGVSSLNVSRNKFYEKELVLKLSRSYGPGRYDPYYEELGHDYPPAYVRWTEKRNMQAFLGLLKEKKIALSDMITRRIPFDKARDAYSILLENKMQNFVSILLEYKGDYGREKHNETRRNAEPLASVNMGIIGAGKFARSFLLPFLQRESVGFDTVINEKTESSIKVKDRYGFRNASSSVKDITDNNKINLVVIATRHNTHGQFVIEALERNKAVYVEKPLTIYPEELDKIKELINNGKGFLMVGFNRRFAPLVRKIKYAIKDIKSPFIANYFINAGKLPGDSWIKIPDISGGRIVGEVCHFVDVFNFLSNSQVVRVYASALKTTKDDWDDNVSVVLEYGDGSRATIIYTSMPDYSIPKERMEIHKSGISAFLDNFKSLHVYSGGKKSGFKDNTVSKGHKEEMKALVNALKNGQPSPISFRDIYNVTLTTFKIRESMRTGKPIEVEEL